MSEAVIPQMITKHGMWVFAFLSLWLGQFNWQRVDCKMQRTTTEHEHSFYVGVNTGRATPKIDDLSHSHHQQHGGHDSSNDQSSSCCDDARCQLSCQAVSMWLIMAFFSYQASAVSELTTLYLIKANTPSVSSLFRPPSLS